LLGFAITYKIAAMAVGSKFFLQEAAAAASTAAELHVARSAAAIWCEILLVFGLLEAVLWTPRGPLHTLLIVSALGSVLWLGFRGFTREQLGLVWPCRGGWWILGLGCGFALAIPAVSLLTGHPLPANSDWPTFRNIWPYVLWAFGQQFLLQSFFYLRFEALLGGRTAVIANTILFTLAHLPNWPLTVMTLFGAMFFTEMFRRYRSIYPLGVVHALLGIAVAYSVPDSLMHHMRVGLSFWNFR
jgi:membrane protease YdiL (CAAX protease family)